MRAIFDDAMRRRTFGNHMWIEMGREKELFSLNISYHKTIESGEFISLGVVWCVITVYESKSNGIAFFFCYLFIQSETTGRKPTKTDLRSEAKKRKEYICWNCRKRFWFVSFTPAECELASVCVCVCLCARVGHGRSLGARCVQNRSTASIMSCLSRFVCINYSCTAQ